MKKLFASLMAVGLLVGVAAVSQAATFAQFQQVTGDQNFTFNGGGNTGTLSSTNDPILFQFKSGSGLNITAPTGIDILADLTFSAQGNGTVVTAVGGPQVMQNVSFSILAHGAQTIGGQLIPNGALLLSGNTGANPTAGNLSGGPNSASIFVPIQPPFPNTLVFMSNYINFAGSPTQLMTGFSIGLTPGLTYSPNTPPAIGLHINPFSSAAAGTFSAVPEPGSIALFSSLAVCGSVFGFNRLRRRK